MVGRPMSPRVPGVGSGFPGLSFGVSRFRLQVWDLGRSMRALTGFSWYVEGCMGMHRDMCWDAYGLGLRVQRFASARRGLGRECSS